MTDMEQDNRKTCGGSKGQSVICRFIEVSRMHRRAICKYSSDIGLHHSQHRMLMHLANNEVIRSQKQLAEQLGYNQSMISFWEKGINEPTETAIRKAALFFEVSADYLLGLED